MSDKPAAAPPPTPIDVKDRRAVAGPEASDLLDEKTLQPGFTYRWVQERPSNVVSKRTKGYTFVNRKDGVRTLFEQDDNAGDGLIRHGDRILMKIPTKLNADKRRHNLRISEARLKSSDAAVRDLAARQGVKLSEGDEEK